MNTQTGIDLFEALISEIHQADPEMLPPPFKKEPKEKPLGVVYDETIRRTFSLSSFYRREAKRLQIDLEALGTDPHDDPTFSMYKQKHQALQEIFWYLLRSHMELFKISQVGVRQGWEVVETASDETNQIIAKNLPKFLRKLFEEE